MALCKWCDQDMTMVSDCEKNRTVKYPDGMILPALPSAEPGRCHDCRVQMGAYHHPGCDAERCPRCQGQLISCGCLDNLEDDDEED